MYPTNIRFLGRCRPAHLNQTLDTNHPIAPLIRLSSHDVLEQIVCPIKLSGLNGLRQFTHFLHRIRLQQILVVQMIKQDIQPLFGVEDLRSELGRRTGFDTLHLRTENSEDWLRGRRDV